MDGPERVNPGGYFQRPTTFTLSTIQITYKTICTHVHTKWWILPTIGPFQAHFFLRVFFSLSAMTGQNKKNGCDGMGHLVRRSRFWELCHGRVQFTVHRMKEKGCIGVIGLGWTGMYSQTSHIAYPWDHHFSMQFERLCSLRKRFMMIHM